MLKQLEYSGVVKSSKLTYLPCYPSSNLLSLNYGTVKKQYSFVGRFVEKKAHGYALAFKKFPKDIPMIT